VVWAIVYRKLCPVSASVIVPFRLFAKRHCYVGVTHKSLENHTQLEGAACSNQTQVQHNKTLEQLLRYDTNLYFLQFLPRNVMLAWSMLWPCHQGHSSVISLFIWDFCTILQQLTRFQMK